LIEAVGRNNRIQLRTTINEMDVNGNKWGKREMTDMKGAPCERNLSFSGYLGEMRLQYLSPKLNI
jgi:hypothetical protein